MTAVVIDSNLLVLLIVGYVSRELIGRHRRLRAYTEEDFDLLCGLIAGHSPILVTPNTLTEASNLCRQIAGHEHAQIGQAFRAFVGMAEEQYVDSKVAVQHERFLELGLTDVAILQQLENAPLLITADLVLFVAAIQRGYRAINFNHVRPVW